MCLNAFRCVNMRLNMKKYEQLTECLNYPWLLSFSQQLLTLTTLEAHQIRANLSSFVTKL